MRVESIVALCLLSFNALSQFKPDVVINGVTYKSTVNTADHVTYIQQDCLDLSIAADSFYMDVVSDEEWLEMVDKLISEEGAVLKADGMYHTDDGCQVFLSDHPDKYTGKPIAVRLFGSTLD